MSPRIVAHGCQRIRRDRQRTLRTRHVAILANLLVRSRFAVCRRVPLGVRGVERKWNAGVLPGLVDEVAEWARELVTLTTQLWARRERVLRRSMRGDVAETDVVRTMLV